MWKRVAFGGGAPANWVALHTNTHSLRNSAPGNVESEWVAERSLYHTTPDTTPDERHDHPRVYGCHAMAVALLSAGNLKFLG
jgi:hypothetical protein